MHTHRPPTRPPLLILKPRPVQQHLKPLHRHTIRSSDSVSSKAMFASPAVKTRNMLPAAIGDRPQPVFPSRQASVWLQAKVAPRSSLKILRPSSWARTLSSSLTNSPPPEAFRER